MTRPKATIKTLSEYCNVSVATISRVINNNGRFSEQTRQRVLRAIDELGYIPNSSAKTLRTNSSHLVGIFVNSLRYEMTSSMVVKLQSQLLVQGYISIICNIGIDSEEEAKYYNLMRSLNACAIFMMVIRNGVTPPENLKIPIFYIYKNPLRSSEIDNTYILETNDFEAGYLAGNELIRLGCRRIAEVRLKSLDDHLPLGRHLGLLHSLYEHNIPFSENLSVVSDDSSFSAVLEAINNLLDHNEPADGYFCVSDVLALCLIRALETHGHKIPEDVKVIGCNDMPLALYNTVGITTIRHQEDEMCEAAAKLLNRVLSGEDIALDQRRCVFHVTLVRRGTT